MGKWVGGWGVAGGVWVGSGPKLQNGKTKISELINFRALEKSFYKTPTYEL